ncbi:hypothetical protein EGR_00491 [Echinococcus granulosus]|uniref:Uncharacterized protein n=1 Tax=Echinococcus granulosus TaxID=6210 RepID=W6UV93_ECHGR|nr:hypothetical protein EGR_00491 [Echinococcus granulosus]EUB64541.1 hypothetical protein EGR_00491 [Echinococcus granulosus]
MLDSRKRCKTRSKNFGSLKIEMTRLFIFGFANLGVVSKEEVCFTLQKKDHKLPSMIKMKIKNKQTKPKVNKHKNFTPGRILQILYTDPPQNSPKNIQKVIGEN